MKQQVILMLGSPSDEEYAEKITRVLSEYKIPFKIRIASAHRTPQKVQQIIRELEKKQEQLVIIAIVGLSNALSGMLAGISAIPVITCPIYNPEDINASLRMPSGVAHGTVLNPENAALYALKILALSNSNLKKKIQHYLEQKQHSIDNADAKIQHQTQ